MSALLAPSLRSQRQFVGTVDATGDSTRATARTLDQLQGQQRSSIALIVPMGAAEPMSLGQRIVTGVSVVCGCFVVALLIAERWFA